jgi:heme a synthase
MPQPETQPWLHRFAVLTAVATLVLIGIGGLVTSHEAGMSVPDWPTSYGYNMFLFPLSRWWHAGNIFYEHSHRLFASGVGLLTTILAVWLWFKEPRAWLRRLGVIAWVAVVLQGVLGGLRVVLFKDQIGIFHAALAQLFFVLVCAIALFTSQWWREGERRSAGRAVPETGVLKLRGLFLATTVLVLFQLVLGATMRHQHAGLAIPDFPLAYGKLWPATDPESVARYNERRMEVTAANPITAFQIELQMAHRLTAALILAAVAWCAWKVRNSVLERLALVWLGLVLVQAALGAFTLWSNKAADVATAHVLVGALSLAVGGILCIVSAHSPQWKRNARGLSPDMACAGCGDRAVMAEET